MAYYRQVRRLDMAAKMAGVCETTPYIWRRNDPKFKEDLENCHEVIGDHYIGQIEEQSKTNILGTMFLVKRYKPEFRDKQPSIEINQNYIHIQQLLVELRQAGPVAALGEGGATE